MKTGIIPSTKLDIAYPLGLSARAYICPTSEVDKKIANLTHLIEQHRARLVVLKAEREVILRKQKEMYG